MKFDLFFFLQNATKNLHTSMRVELGMGTGADNKRKIHVSISFTS